MSREKPCRVGYHVARTARPGHFLQICACARRLASPGGHRRRGLFRVLYRPLASSLARCCSLYLAQWALAHDRRYYIGCNCSLVSYIITADDYRGCGLSRKSAVESWAPPACHICTGTGLTPPTPPWAYRCHIYAGLVPALDADTDRGRQVARHRYVRSDAPPMFRGIPCPMGYRVPWDPVSYEFLCFVGYRASRASRCLAPIRAGQCSRGNMLQHCRQRCYVARHASAP